MRSKWCCILARNLCFPTCSLQRKVISIRHLRSNTAQVLRSVSGTGNAWKFGEQPLFVQTLRQVSSREDETNGRSLHSMRRDVVVELWPWWRPPVKPFGGWYWLVRLTGHPTYHALSFDIPGIATQFQLRPSDELVRERVIVTASGSKLHFPLRFTA